MSEETDRLKINATICISLPAKRAEFIEGIVRETAMMGDPSVYQAFVEYDLQTGRSARLILKVGGDTRRKDPDSDDLLTVMGTDAATWAKEFHKRFGPIPSESTLISWFANAIEAGATREAKPALGIGEDTV